MLAHGQLPIQKCIVCENEIVTYAFQVKSSKFFQCDHCRLLVAQRDLTYHNGHSDLPVSGRDSATLCQLIMSTLQDRKAHGRHLVIGVPGEQSLMNDLKARLPEDTEFAPPLHLPLNASFQTVIVLMPISMMADVETFLLQLRGLLAEEGVLVMLQPMIDSSQAKLMKKSWLELNESHYFYPMRDTFHILMLKNGFDRLWFRKARYPYSLKYMHQRLSHSPSSVWHRAAAFLLRLVPSFLRGVRIRLPSSHIIASAQLAPAKKEEKLSVVVPVFNEKNTFEELIQALLAKQVDGMRKEVIIVESQSTDGTRDLVKKYENHPEVKVIWQEKPRGKGFAVREGFAAATGDYLMIQDADLEYDLNDYESLLAPLRANKAMFVLGSRHSGSWKIREFNNEVTTAAIFNLGHVFFTTFVNLVTGQRMADPFTMFKVIRRDVLFGLLFTCRRFDFDYEMVIKFIRKGYQPLELPVNYRSRSFAEGKKVSFIKDGLTWFYIIFKLRFGRLSEWQS